MADFEKEDFVRSIVAQDSEIRKALNFGHGPDFLLHRYQYLDEIQKLAFVAAMAGMLSMKVDREGACLPPTKIFAMNIDGGTK